MVVGFNRCGPLCVFEITRMPPCIKYSSLTSPGNKWKQISLPFAHEPLPKSFALSSSVSIKVIPELESKFSSSRIGRVTTDLIFGYVNGGGDVGDAGDDCNWCSKESGIQLISSSEIQILKSLVFHFNNKSSSTLLPLFTRIQMRSKPILPSSQQATEGMTTLPNRPPMSLKVLWFHKWGGTPKIFTIAILSKGIDWPHPWLKFGKPWRTNRGWKKTRGNTLRSER